MAKNIITKQIPMSKATFEEEKEYAMAIGFKMVHEIEHIAWSRMSSVLKAMRKKYTSEESHELFEENIYMAQTM